MKNLSEIIHDLDMVTKQYVDDAAAAKVDKVEGKQLSTNDFTTEEKEKLAGLSITQYSTLPTANIKTYKDIVQYVGNTTEEYTTGYFYQCQKLEVGYGWVAINVQDIDWSNLNSYSTNMVVAKATTDDAETGIYNIKIKSLPTAYAYGGLPLDIIYDENGEAPANVLKLFAGNVVATASITAANRTALFSGTNFYVTYNGVKKKIEVPKTDSTPTNAQLGYILQDLISNAFGSNILKVGPSGMKIAFSLNDFGGGTNWTDGAPTIILEDGDENNALIPLHIDNGSVLGFNINLPLNQLLDASVFVDGVYTLNLRSGVAANGTIFWQSESFNFLETDTIGKVFETINNSKLTVHIYYDAINNRVMIESTVGGPNGVFDWGEDWTLWNALNITETLRTDIDQYIADGGYVSTGANGYFDLTSPSGQVFTDVILTTKQCYFRGIEFNFANANPNESYLIAVTTQKSEDGTYTTLENKPTLNGVEIDGDKTALDYGINDTNVYYGTEEPTAENVVMWVDPSGAPVSVLTTDNTIEYTPTGDYNPATKKYVDEHGVNTDEIYAMDNYELLTLEQEDLSQEIKSSVYGQLDSTSSTSTWTGHIVGKQDPETWNFSISSTRTLAINNSTVQTQNNIWSVVDGDATLTKAGINTALARSSYNGDYALKNMVHKTTTTSFGWDFKKSTTFTFKYRISLTESTNFTAATAVLKGSNDNSTWTTLSNLSMTNADLTYTATTPYRYILLSITQTNNSGTTASGISSKWTIYYMRFTQVTDTLVRFNNNFTSKNNFAIQNIKRIQIPIYENINQVISNSINGIPVSVILPSQQKTTVEYDNNQLNVHSDVNIIKKGSVSMSASQTSTITCAEATMAFVYTSFTNEIAHWFPLFKDGLATTGHTGSSTSTSYTFSFSKEGVLTITSGSSASARTIEYAFI